MTITAENETAGKAGLVLHAAATYDLLIWLVTLGREEAFREKMLRFAHLQPGESVLDVGCGTGSLAIAAKRQVGPTGMVCGLDASPEMIARAEKKARKAGVSVAFKNAFAQSLPYSAAQFDVVVTTVMLHHLPKKARAELAAEIRRVLKPGGRVLAIDFGGTARNRKSFIDHFHRRHGHVEFKQIVALLSEAGLSITNSGAVGMRDLEFVLATVPCLIAMSRNGTITGHSLFRRRIWMLAALAAMLIAGHGIILYYASAHLALSAWLLSGILLLIVIKHLGLLGPVYALFRRRVISVREKQSGKG